MIRGGFESQKKGACMNNHRRRSKKQTIMLVAVEKTKNVTATVVLPISVRINVLRSASPEQIRKAIFDFADKLFEMGGIDPLITECSDEQLID
jgi:hypothetical protein